MKQFKKEIINAIIPMGIIIMVEIIFKIINDAAIFFNSNSIILSILMGYTIYIIGLGISKKTWIASTILSILLVLILIINQIKIIYTGEPVYFSDINFINKISDFREILTVNNKIIKFNQFIGLGILIIILGIIIFCNKKYNMVIKSNKLRLTIVTIMIIINIILFAPISSIKEIYLNLFFEMDENKDYNSHTTNLSFYLKNSLLSGMYGVMLNNRFSEPKNYDENELNNILDQISKETVVEKKENPNIIVIFSESFWNIDKLDEIKFNKKVTENYDKISEKEKLVNILSCTYGGMSENVAFELLTGGKLNYFSDGYIPIMSLYQRKNSNQIPSIVKELKNNNYKTKIIFGKDYYNSKNAILKMGFDEYMEVEQTAENTKGYFVSDEYLTDLIIKSLETKQDKEKVFYMVETIQSHMPYTIKKYNEYNIQLEKSELDNEMNEVIMSYAQGVYDADQQLGRIYEYIKKYKEPTIVLFLGDHLPYMYTEKGQNVLDSLKYFNTQDELLNTYRKYNTQSLIFSNFELEYEKFPNYLSTDLLLTYVINQTDIELSSYFKWLYKTKEQLPAYNKNIGIDEYGNIYNIKKMNENMKKIYNIRENMQFKLFIKPTI